MRSRLFLCVVSFFWVVFSAESLMGAVLFTENWDSNSINPSSWNLTDIAPQNIFTRNLGGSDYALSIEGNNLGWGDQLYSAATYERDGFVSIIFKTWEGSTRHGLYGTYSGFHKTNSTIYASMEAALGYVYSDIRAAGGEDGIHGFSGGHIIGGNSANKMLAFDGAIVNANDKAHAITVRITLGDVSGARWEWSNDNGATWVLERDTIGNSLADNVIDNYIGFGTYEGPSYGGMIDDIVVDRKYGLIRESGGRTDVNEQQPSSDTYTVVLGGSPIDGGPTANVTVTVTPDSQLNVNGAGGGVPIVLTFTPTDFNVPQTVTVRAVDDSLSEGLHAGTITHTLASADAKYNGQTLDNVVAHITDNDLPGFTIVQSGGSTDVNENGTRNDSYTIQAIASPSQPVTLTVTPDSQLRVNSAAGGTPVMLTFNSSNWMTAQTVTVSAVNNSLSQGPHTGTITHTSSSSASNWNNLSLPSVVVNITDDEHYCGEPGQIYDVADIAGPNGVGNAYRDCHVNFYDFAYLALQWMKCTNLFDPTCSWN